MNDTDDLTEQLAREFDTTPEAIHLEAAAFAIEPPWEADVERVEQ